MKVGILGYGNMGSCLGERLKSKYEVWAFDKDNNKTINISGIQIAGSTTELVEKIDTVILAIKPQDFQGILDEIKSDIKGKLLISIAAGITIGFIEKYLGKIRIVRVMPNMPARVGKAMTCLCNGQWASDTDLSFAKGLFDNLGKTLILDEEMMDAATAISGSGPGYIYYLIENEKLDIQDSDQIDKFTKDFVSVAEGFNFNHDEAVRLVEATVDGSIVLLKESNLTASELKKQIASKGGTTEAAFKVLDRGGSLEEAVKAARDRSRELSRK